jgi:ParB/RepB/Spo0J family partition protein
MEEFKTMNLPGYIEQIDIDLLGTELTRFRLINEGQIKRMKGSLNSLGMLHPVIVGKGPRYQIIDGFKRYYASRELDLKEISCRVLDITITEGKALIISSNRGNCHTVDYEEASIVYSLKAEDGLSGREIAVLLNQSTSWVSRRLSLIEKLDLRVRDQIKLGLLSPSHARGILKLPRGNQEKLSESIIKHGLNTREGNIIVEAYLKAKNTEEQLFIINNPRQVITNISTKGEPSYDYRLSKEGNKLLKTTDILHRQQCILIGQLSGQVIQKLTGNDKRILLPKFRKVENSSRQILLSIRKFIYQ